MQLLILYRVIIATIPGFIDFFLYFHTRKWKSECVRYPSQSLKLIKGMGGIVIPDTKPVFFQLGFTSIHATSTFNGDIIESSQSFPYKSEGDVNFILN